jgi:quercetin dioxygenase-like cupin family protein
MPEMKIVKNENKVFCVVHSPKDWKEGLDFLTDDGHSVQVGTWWYQAGKVLDRHYHNQFERSAPITMEVIIVIQGALEIDIYDEQQKLVSTFNAKKGDIVIFGYGGHGYRVLADNTKIIEVKNGPFLGVERDKTRF